MPSVFGTVSQNPTLATLISFPGNHFSLAARSGALTAVAAAGPVFAFRNAQDSHIVVHRVGIGFIATTGFTAAQVLDFGLYAARSFTVADSGGTTITLTTNNAKRKTLNGGLVNASAFISTTGALTTGTRTLDATPLAAIQGYAAATTAGVIIPFAVGNLLNTAPAEYPLVLGINEGFEIAPITTMGAAGVGQLMVAMEFTEHPSYD